MNFSSDRISLINLAINGLVDQVLYYRDDLPFDLKELGQWWGTDPKEKKQVQIDIVGTPMEGKEYIIGPVNTAMKRSVWRNWNFSETMPLYLEEV